MNIKPLRYFRQQLVLGILAGLFACTHAGAQTPVYAYAPTTVTTDIIPLGSATNNAAQYLFTPGNFAPSMPSTGGIINKIYVKAGNTQSSGSTFTNLNVTMGATSATTLSSSAWTVGLTSVYSAASTTISSWTSGGWIAITLQTPFTWNGTSNLVVTIYQDVFTNPLSLQQGTVSGRNGRVYGYAYNATPSAADANLISFGFDLGCNGTPSTPTITTAAFTTAAPLCSGGTTTVTATYPSPPVVSGITYQWQSSASSTGPWTNVTGGSGATTLSYTTGAITANTYFRMGATCTNSSLTSFSSAFLVPIGSPQPSTISGPVTFCPGDPINYSVTNVPGSTYTWTLPSGWSGTSTTSSILVTPGTTAGTISVAATSSCGPISITRSITPVAGSAPSTPGTVFGNNLICAGTTQTYSVLPVNGATSYIWTFPSGWTGASTTNSITVTVNNNSGNVTAMAVNGCGQSGNATPLAVNIITALANPGTITGKDTVCSGTLQVYSISPVPGAASYTWILPSGWSGTTTGTSIQVFSGTGGGTLSVTAYSACATSPTAAKTLAVTQTVTPSVTIGAPPAATCERTPITFLATAVNGGTSPGYQWKKNGTTVTGASNSYTDNALVSSDVITVTLTSNAVCKTTATATSNSVSANIIPLVNPGVSINTTPSVIICKGTPLTFTTTSTGSGTTPSYQWFKNGFPIPSANGTTYTDGFLNNADTITIRMTTSAACATVPGATSNKVGVQVNDTTTPTATISVSPNDIVIPGQPLTFTATQTNGGATPNYQWQKNGVNIPYETGDTYTSSTLMPGDHIAVRMLSYEPCANMPLVLSNEIALKNYTVNVAGAGGWDGSVKLYPNPTNGRFSIAASWNSLHSGSQVRVEVLSSIGQMVHRVELIPSSANWQTEVVLPAGVANGHYMLRISTEDGMRTTLPFVLNR